MRTDFSCKELGDAFGVQPTKATQVFEPFAAKVFKFASFCHRTGCPDRFVLFMADVMRQAREQRGSGN
jgi:hypothetical protein